MSLASAGARGGLTTVLSQAASLIVRLVGLIFLARLLPADIFGLAAIATAIATFASTIIYLGLPMAVLQAESVSEKAKSSLLIVNCSLGIALALALFLLAEPIAAFYKDSRLVILMQFLSLVPILSGIQSQFRLHLIKNLRFTGISVTDFVAQIISTVVAIVLGIQGFAIEAIIAQNVLISLCQLVLTIILSRWVPKLPGMWKSEVKGLLLIGLRIFATTALRDGSRSVVVPVMATAVSPGALGNFDRAQQLSVLPISLTVDQLQRVAVPVLSRLRDEPQRMFAFMRRAQLLLTYITVTVFMMVAALGDDLVFTVLGPNWQIAGTVLQVLALGAVFRTLGQSMQWLFIASESTNVALRFSLWTQPLIVLTTLAGLPWGVIGVAAANSLAWAIYWPIATLKATRACSFPSAPLITDALRGILLFGLPVSLAALSAKLFSLNEWQTLIVGMLFAMVVAGILIAAVHAVRKDVSALVDALRLAMRRNV